MKKADANLKNNFYEKYVGQYCKRFYTMFKKEFIFKITDFELKNGVAHFTCVNSIGESWEWDVEDCVIITNETPIIEDERVANVNDPNYNKDMYSPY